MKKNYLLGLSLCFSIVSFAASADKEATILQLRSNFAQQRSGTPVLNVAAEEVWTLLTDEGRFTDKRAEEDTIISRNYAADTNMAHCIRINNLARDCFERLQALAETYRGREELNPFDPNLNRLLRGISFYGRIENERNPDAPGRFHASCFATPRAAVNIYFSLLPLMDRIESGALTDAFALEARKKLIDVGFQSWTQPYRQDDTDKNVVSVDRFRKHVWWVGGNALDYRPVLEAAVMMKSIPMVDVLAEVAKRSFSVVSQTTYADAFWTEGTTADGAGWGHGMQCLVWGYPIDGLKGSFRILGLLQGSPWAQQLSRENVEVLLNYLRGSAFYHHKGVIPPLVDRGNMIRKNNRKGDIPSYRIARSLLNDWSSALTVAERAELEQFIHESSAFDVKMANLPDGFYHGTRYFYNNDDLIKKTPAYYLFLNMGSARVDGLESAYPNAAGYNFFSADGVTLFQREGSEYRNILGAMNLTAWPGITTRQTPTELQPIENWRGYTSRYDFCAGATDGKGSFAAGFISQKVDATMKPHPDASEAKDKNKDIYGVRAWKSYFMFDDLFLALGAGITNLQPEKEGDITTTIEQTYSPQPVIEQRKGKRTSFVHQGFTYAVLPEQTTGEVHSTRLIRPTHWARLCKLNTEPETEVPVFQLEINHGRKPENATYAYVVACHGELPNKLPVVLSNTVQLQAAESAEGHQLGAVVYDPSRVIKGRLGTFTVSAPVALFAERKGDKLILTIADAKMDIRLDHLTVTLNGHPVTVSMPVEPDRGKPITIELETKNF